MRALLLMTCMATLTSCLSTQGYCLADVDCPSGRQCVENRCQDKFGSFPTLHQDACEELQFELPQAPSCAEDHRCFAGQVCVQDCICLRTCDPTLDAGPADDGGQADAGNWCEDWASCGSDGMCR